MTVLGVKSPKAGSKTVKVFVEVLNPTNQPLSLKRLEYRFKANDWINTNGKMQMARKLAPGGKAIVEILVPLPEQVPEKGVLFHLEAKLIGLFDKGERSWELRAQGEIVGIEGRVGQVAVEP